MNILGIGPPEVAIIAVCMAPVVAFILIYRRLGEINRNTQRRPPIVPPSNQADIRRDTV